MNEKIEQITTFFGYALVATIIIIALPTMCYSIVCYFALDLGTESFLLSFPTWFVYTNYLKTPLLVFLLMWIRWPFDWRTPFGYFLAWLSQSTGVAAVTLAVIPFYCILFGSCWLFIVIARDITADVAAFNKVIKTRRDSAGADRLMASIHGFCDIVRNYSDVKE